MNLWRSKMADGFVKNVVIKYVFIIKNVIFVKNKFVVYILRTDKNTLYTGQTNDLEERLKKHRNGKGAKYIRGFKSFKLVYRESFSSRIKAMKREAEIKGMAKAQKEKLVGGSGAGNSCWRTGNNGGRQD